MENNMEITQKLKTGQHLIQQSHIWIYNQRKLNRTLNRYLHSLVFTAAAFIIAKMWDQPKWPSMEVQTTEYYPDMTEGNPVICDNVDGT